MEYKIKRFSAVRPVVSKLTKEAATLLGKGLTAASKEGKDFLLRAGHLSNSYGKIAKSGKVLKPNTWGKASVAKKSQEGVGKVIRDFYKGSK